MKHKRTAAFAAILFLMASQGCAALGIGTSAESSVSEAASGEPAAESAFSQLPSVPVQEANMSAAENFAAMWNLNLGEADALKLDAAEAIAADGTGILEGAQILMYILPPGELYLYTLEGVMIGARMVTHTNAWSDASEARDWNTCWKVMVQCVNGNWTDSRYVDIISQMSSALPPAGQEAGTVVGDVIQDNGWVYQMADEDLGYEHDKTVSAWFAEFAGAA